MAMNSPQTDDIQFHRKLGQRIRYFRAIALGKTQEQLGAQSDTSSSTICRIELGAVDVTISKLKQIADALCVELYDLMDVDENRLKEVSDADIDLDRLYASIDRLDEVQKKIVAGAIRGTLNAMQEASQSKQQKNETITTGVMNGPFQSVKPASKQARKDLPLRA